jgi:hypothetical protein
MAKAMLAATGGNSPASFVVLSNPIAPSNPSNNPVLYTVSTNMYMLPPRPLGETAGFDGLYLITLVDERYYFRGIPGSLKIIPGTTWAQVITQLASALGMTLSYSAIPASYGAPEPDSQLWTSSESAAFLLDAVAATLGRVCVRGMNANYNLLLATESAALVSTNRSSASVVVRMAGGDLFENTNLLPVGSLSASKNAVVPAQVNVLFQKYVQGDDPVPHSANSRYANQRASAWYENSDTYEIIVPISAIGGLAAGLTGVGQHTIRDTAKALYPTEASLGGSPTNVSLLNSTALQIATDYYASQVAAALDEKYPGTLNWTPEGIHDLIWTYSERTRQASLRVMRTEWNTGPLDMLHQGLALAGQTPIPRGVGGPSVAQTWRDSFSGNISSHLMNTMLVGDTVAVLTQSDYLPTQNRWKGQIDSEIILFEGTSGGTSVGVVYRGIDGTIAAGHSNNSVVSQVVPDTHYGVNLLTVEKSQFIYPQEVTSGGIAGARLVPQVQTVQVLSPVGVTINGLTCFSGQVNIQDTTQTGVAQYQKREFVWLFERNSQPATSGSYFEGQFTGYSASTAGAVAPIYLFNGATGGAGGGFGVAVNDVLFPPEPAIDVKQGSHVTVTGLDVPGQWTAVTINTLADGTVQNFFNVTWNFFNSTINFDITTVIIIGGPITINGPFVVCGFQFWCCRVVTTWTTSQDNFVLPTDNVTKQGAVVYLIASAFSSGIDLTGIVPVNTSPGVPGPLLIALVNNGVNPIRLVSQSAASANGNKLLLPHDPNVGAEPFLMMNPDDAVVLWYDTCSKINGGLGAWRVLAHTCIFGKAGAATHGTGLVPDPGVVTHLDCTTFTYLRDDATWANPFASGLTTSFTFVTGVTFDSVACSVSFSTKNAGFTCGLLTGLA